MPGGVPLASLRRRCAFFVQALIKRRGMFDRMRLLHDALPCFVEGGSVMLAVTGKLPSGEAEMFYM